MKRGHHAILFLSSVQKRPNLNERYTGVVRFLSSKTKSPIHEEYERTGGNIGSGNETLMCCDTRIFT